MPRSGSVEGLLPESGSRPLLLDGGLATELEARGLDLSTRLWSGRALVDHPDLVRASHRAFVDAGAEVVSTVTYQCSVAALLREGIDAHRARRLYRRSVALVRDALGEGEGIAAVSLGPYGAYRADGSEYHGGYGRTVEDLVDFHRPTWEVAVAAGGDCLAVETVPDAVEVEALRILADEVAVPGGMPAWLALSVDADARLADGTPLDQVARSLRGSAFCALGVNCCRPSVVTDALAALAPAGLPLIAYPNSGERYEDGRWCGEGESIEGHVEEWLDLGVVAVGGCCRTTPRGVRSLASLLTERYGRS